MFPHAHYAQPAPARHMYLEPIQLPGPCGVPCRPHRFARHHHQPFAAAAPMLEPPSQSPTATCYSPGGSLASDGTISDYAADVLGSPSPSLASPGAGSPPPHPHPAGATTGARKPQRRGTRAQYTAEEKERRRKVSHSAIEKRRRERTNSVLNKLQRMVPGLSKSSKIQKLEILQASAVYICELRRQLNLPSTAAADDDEDGDASDDDGCCSDGNGTGARSQMKVDFLLT